MTHEQAQKLWRLINNYIEACCEEVDIGGFGCAEDRKRAFHELNAFIYSLEDE